MNARLIAVLPIVLTTGCPSSSSSSSEEQGSATPAGVTAAPTTAAAQPGAPAAAGKQPGAQPAGGSSAAVSVANQDKKVDANTGPNGSTLNVENDAGKGSVSTSSSGVTVKGKSGNAVTIPTGIPALPHK